MAARCQDCLADIVSPPYFMVVKVREERDPEDHEFYPLLYESIVCTDCVGWYGDDYFEVEELD